MQLRLLAIITVTALLGLADATYLTILHYQNAIPPCTIAHGCETVLTSKYATIFFGIPTALLGALYYVVIFILMFLFAQTKKPLWVFANSIISSAAFVIAIVLIGVQAFILHAFCQYCLASDFIDTLLVVFSWLLLKEIKKKSQSNNIKPSL